MEKEIKLFHKISFIFLIVVSTCIVVFLRFYALGSIPKGINVDEASYGYDAYSLLKTGKDMWGSRGTTLKSFGDYKPAGLSYTLVPLVKHFGLSTLTTRLPSAIFGFLTLIVTFFIVQTLTSNHVVAFISSIVLGLSPWHFGLSRLFYEPNIGLFFISCSIYFQLQYLKNNHKIKYLIISSIFVAIAGYYYSVLRYIGVGTLGIAVLVGGFHAYKQILKHCLIFGIVWALVALPYLGDMFGVRGLVRLSQEGKLQEFGNVLVITENRQMCYISSEHNSLIAQLCYALWNKPGEKLVNATRTYIELLSPKYLFLNGYQKDVVPANNGAYIASLLPFFLVGIYIVLLRFKKNILFKYVLVSTLFAIIPVALAGAQNIHRNVVGLYLVLMIIMIGVNETLCLMRNKSWKFALYPLILIIMWSQSRYLANYYYIFTRVQPEIWSSDTPDLMSWLGDHAREQEISFYDYDFGPLYYSFYNKLDPTSFQKNAVWDELNQYGWTRIHSITGKLTNDDNIWRNICAQSNPSRSSHLLVITGSKSEWQEVAQFQTKNFTGIHILHEVYDSKILYDYLNKKDSVALTTTCSSQK
ncbi:MAG: glycosyltransferase family 39 protein [Microgenomates group bacterium]